MVQWYVEFNEQFFDGELEEIELRVGRLERKTHGCFYKPKDEGFHPEECNIALNVKIMDTLEGWRLVMLHEMVHYYVYKHYGKVKRPHGKEFKDVAKRINDSEPTTLQPFLKHNDIDELSGCKLGCKVVSSIKYIMLRAQLCIVCYACLDVEVTNSCCSGICQNALLTYPDCLSAT